MALYLGLDLSTQSVSAVAIVVEPDDPAVAKTRQVAAEISLSFDEILPAYGTKGGVLPSADPQTRRSPIRARRCGPKRSTFSSAAFGSRSSTLAAFARSLVLGNSTAAFTSVPVRATSSSLLIRANRLSNRSRGFSLERPLPSGWIQAQPRIAKRLRTPLVGRKPSPR